MRQRRKSHRLKKTRRNSRPQKSRRRTKRHVQRLLTALELGAILRMSRKALYAYASRNIIPQVRIESNIRFPKQQVLDWVADRLYQPNFRSKAKRSCA